MKSAWSFLHEVAFSKCLPRVKGDRRSLRLMSHLHLPRSLLFIPHLNIYQRSLRLTHHLHLPKLQKSLRLMSYLHLPKVPTVHATFTSTKSPKVSTAHVIFIPAKGPYGLCHIYTSCGELLPAEEEGGKNSSQYFIKYLSRLIMLKMYRKTYRCPFYSFPNNRNVKKLLSMTAKISIERGISSSF